LAAIYPLSERFGQTGRNVFFQALSSVSDYIVIFFLYLFLALLLVDLILLLNRLFRFISPEKQRGFSFRFYTLSSMILFSIIVVAGGAINLNTIRVSNYTIEIPRRNSKIDRLRVAFVADLHIQQNSKLSYTEQFVNKVNTLKPDILLYGGDIVEGNNQNRSTEAIESALNSIHTKYGEFGVLGNHDSSRGRNIDSFFKKAGINILGDSIVEFESAFCLAGRNDERFRDRKTIDELIDKNPNDLPILLMDHRPTQLQEVSKTAVNAQFSGHTHNGQLFPLNLIINSMYELGWGYKKIRDTHFFVTSGLRLWGPQVRTVGKSEIMLIDIRFK
jgi:predicted MPP superfamily phosphohydrolase